MNPISRALQFGHKHGWHRPYVSEAQGNVHGFYFFMAWFLNRLCKHVLLTVVCVRWSIQSRIG